MGFMIDWWNRNKFTVYDSEELTVLKMVNKMLGFFDTYSIELDNKTNLEGDHKGSWQGINRPTKSNEGLAGTVEQIIDITIPSINSQLEQIAHSFLLYGIVSDGVTDCTNSLQQYINYCYNNNLICYIPNGCYNIRQISLPSMVYKFGTKVEFYQNANVPCIVNEHIDFFGSGAKYQSITSIYQAEKNGEMDKISFIGGFEVKKASNYVELLPGDQILYKGKRWIDSEFGYMGRFPVNFVGLIDSEISNITIDYETKEANINLGFSMRTNVYNCKLHKGKDNCLQFFASINCIAYANKTNNGGGGLFVMQNCKNCIFINNMLTYLDKTTGVNSYMISLKNSECCSVTDNIVDGYGNNESIGIAITSQNGGCDGTLISDNSILNSAIAIVCENSKDTNIINNTIRNCGSELNNLGSIYINGTSDFCTIENNKLFNNVSHAITVRGGNYLKIINNNIREVLNNKCGILFLDNNTTTTIYDISKNLFYNSSGVGAKSIWFATNSKLLFKHYYINDNSFVNFLGGIYAHNENIENCINKPKAINQNIRLRALGNAAPIFLDGTFFTLTKNSSGNYTLNFLPDTNKRIIIKSINVLYHSGYSPADVKNHIIKVAYDDNANSQRSVKSIQILIYDLITSSYTDNPTTNTNAGTIGNFGLDINIDYEFDYSTWW